MSFVVYKNWIFPEQAFPVDLIKRNDTKDNNSPHGLRLLIQDYPYVVDGLKICSTIETWVQDYYNFYYKNDEMVKEDCEVQCWWKELREEGHTYMPNRSTISRRFMPELSTLECEELESNPEKAFSKTITAMLQTLIGRFCQGIPWMRYLLGRETLKWTTDTKPLEAFKKIGEKLAKIEENIIDMNNGSEEKWRNGVGPAKVPYTLLLPTSETGLTSRGIPNSVSI
ncbi:hypothetical protein HYC85_010200 [Camellia sinensis]|uniref:Lipoxygenase domain-containing protein n=1 Tax=Camellia sinensis TaxID=4442 RepID=A0A7J7HK09_CAMSI|nr:hypothetical protein HYC85_010200 [Camellia sinensis]